MGITYHTDREDKSPRSFLQFQVIIQQLLPLQASERVGRKCAINVDREELCTSVLASQSRHYSSALQGV